jgi:hypothetical protein
VKEICSPAGKEGKSSYSLSDNRETKTKQEQKDMRERKKSKSAKVLLEVKVHIYPRNTKRGAGHAYTKP